jgi:STE24 endopeptidase
MIISMILDIPMALYRTFILEDRFGFNKTTIRIFITDLLKTTLIMVLIGVPMISLVLWIMEHAGAMWWLYVWLAWFLFSLVMMWAYPAFIAPLFNKFRPLEDMELKTRVEALLGRNGFTSQGIFVMDGSTRSSHGNAYFTGLGANKRIVFFDTLIDDLTHPEIEAVLAHELGHFKRNHIKKRIVLMGALYLAGLAVLGWLIEMPWFYLGLGVRTASHYMAITLFVMTAPVFTFAAQPLFSFLSRRHEFEADEFAVAQARKDDLVHALVKLYRENANTLTPDPLYSAFYDSHPPAPIRIAHLNNV